MPAAKIVESNEQEAAHESLEEHEESNDGSENEAVGAKDDGSGANKKKKKKKKNRKKAAAAAAAATVTNQSDGQELTVKIPCQKPHARGLKETAFTDYYVKYGQTDPPTIPVAKLFRPEDGDKEFPLGQILSHPTYTSLVRETSEEARARERLYHDIVTKCRHAAEVHRQVRAYAQSIIRPGIVLADLCEKLENKNRELVVENGLERGIAFPTGCSINHVAAHYSPNTGDDTILNYGDVMKVDFGVQIDGRIIDSAWTAAFDPRYDPLLEAVREATNTGLALAGVDQRLCDIGAAIQETMEGYEIELDGKTYPIRAIRNLNGHCIDPYPAFAKASAVPYPTPRVPPINRDRLPLT